MILKSIFLSVVMFTLASCSSGKEADKVSLQQARIEHEAGRAILIDIRESSEHQTGVAKNAVLLPMSQLLQKQSIIAEARALRAFAYLQLQSYFTTDMADPNALGAILFDFVPATTAVQYHQ